MEYEKGDIVIAKFSDNKIVTKIRGTITRLNDTWCMLDESYVVPTDSLTKILED